MKEKDILRIGDRVQLRSWVYEDMRNYPRGRIGTIVKLSKKYVNTFLVRWDGGKGENPFKANQLEKVNDTGTAEASK